MCCSCVCFGAMSLTFALQALLIRHEAYVADSERERHHMTATIETLEKEKLELEERNAQTIKENRDLLDQLEQLNEAVATSEAQVQALTDTLQSTEEEIQRLGSLAARTQSLEQQLIDLEREQVQLQGALDGKIGDERTAIQRWRRAERTIADLQDQIDRIEREAREERQRHEEIVARMERRMAVDGELANAAARLKAKAGHDKGGSNVVSHFVKDILMDNANLQHGILELREMLLNSNEEVERLRDKLRAHSPVSPTRSPRSATNEDVPTPQSLQKELGKELGGDPVFNQELHIHHHYHGQPPAKSAPKPKVTHRSRKKRFSLTPANFEPSASQDPTSQATILSQTAVTVPSSNRWSNATTLAPSSAPGSPLSMSHRGSIYDRVFSDVAYDSSRPTSPSESNDPQSPMFGPSKSKDSSDKESSSRHKRKKSQGLKPSFLTPTRSISTPLTMTTKSSPATAIISSVSPASSLANEIFTLSPSIEAQSAIPEESEGTSTPNTDTFNSPAPSFGPDFEESDDLVSPMAEMRPTLRRHASHESLISISGMDIHTLQSRPSQLLYGSSRFTSTMSGTSIEPELTPWTATATGNLTKHLDGNTHSRSLLFSTIAANQKRSVNTTNTRKSEGIGKKVGGWVFGKWGATPAPTSAPSSRPESSRSQETMTSQDTAKKSDVSSTPTNSAKKTEGKKEVKLRPAGVNQSGPIWGFFEIPPTPTQVVVTDLDAEALDEALAEG